MPCSRPRSCGGAQTGEDERLEGPAQYLSLGLSLALGLGIFLPAPAAIGQLGERFLSINSWWRNLLEGLVRLALLIGYIYLIGRIPDIRRVFAYHGAEHKTINAFEAGAELEPEIVRRFPLEHTRCGTAFLLTQVLLSVVLFSLLGPLPMGWRLASQILFLPILAGLSYDYIRWTAKHIESPLNSQNPQSKRQRSGQVISVSIVVLTQFRRRNRNEV